MAHLHNWILHGHKNRENFTGCDSMDGPGEHYAKWNKPVRETQLPYDFIHMWDLMNKTKLTSKIETDSQIQIGWEFSEVCGGGGTEQKGKKKELMDRHSNVVIAQGREVVGGGKGCRGINHNGQNTIKVM